MPTPSLHDQKTAIRATLGSAIRTSKHSKSAICVRFHNRFVIRQFFKIRESVQFFNEIRESVASLGRIRRSASLFPLPPRQRKYWVVQVPVSCVCLNRCYHHRCYSCCLTLCYHSALTPSRLRRNHFHIRNHLDHLTGN